MTKTINQFIIDAKLMHKDRCDYSLLNYVTANIKLSIICKVHGIFYQKPKNHLKGSGCSICGLISRTKGLGTIEFIKRSKIIHDNKFSYNQVNYKSAIIPVLIICNKCENIFCQRPSSHLRGYGCKRCAIIKQAKQQRLTTKEFIIKAQQKHNNKYMYNDIIYINNRSKIKIHCPIHGLFWQVAADHLRGRGCVKCKESKGENIIRQYLEKNSIAYIKEYKISNTRKRLDFFISKFQTVIEYNGMQHYVPCAFGSQKYHASLSNLKKNHLSDNYKKKWCQNNNITLLVIHYWEYDQINKILDWFFKEYILYENV